MTRLWRFTPRLAIGGAFLLLVAALAVGIYADRDYRIQKVDAVHVQANILASAITASLAFNDSRLARNYLDALVANPEIFAAAVYDGRGRLFASFRREHAAPVPTKVEVGTSYHGVRVVVVVPVVQKGVRLGEVYLRAATQTFTQRLARYAGFIFLGTMALIVLSVLGLAQRALNRANAELAQRAADLETANMSLREHIAEREKAEEALRQAQKMESIGQLTGGVAHDFNNLLAIILGNLERAERRLAPNADPERVRSALRNARMGAERAATLTRSLLAFSRRQPLRPQSVDINRLVGGMSELLRRTLGEQITVETVLAGGMWRTSVDSNQLENAILNLAVNARDAMPKGGKLTIETANAHLDARYAAAHEDVVPGQYAVICISDTGAGMSKEVIARAFEPFFTTKDVGHGTGLGLSQVYGLVKQSGGHIKIYSEEGEGTTVKIYLPRLMASETPSSVLMPAALREISSSPADRSGAVLVVEDDAGVREHSADILRELGYPVLEASDGAQALGILETHPDIVLLFTDVGLPGGMNGRQLADEAQRRRPDLKVLYTTGYARNAIVHDGRLDPGVLLITKPFTYAELAASVAEALQPRRASLLLIEDEALIRLSTAADLGEFGFEVYEAATAADARAVLARNGHRPTAIIVDLGLPDSAGDDIVVELRSGWPNLPVIVSSGANMDAIRPALIEDPLVRFLQKPYTLKMLVAALKELGIDPQAKGAA